MITVLRLLQKIARARSRSLGDAELEAVWVLTAATFLAVGFQLLGLVLAVSIRRLFNAKDHLRAVRHHAVHHPRPAAHAGTDHSTAETIFQKTGDWFRRHFRTREEPQVAIDSVS